MPVTKMTPETLIALFEAKAAAPPPEASQMLVRHLQCKESLAVSRPSGRQPSLCRNRQPVAHRSDGVAAAAGIGVLASAFPLGLPSLHSLPTAYSHEFRAELLYELCAALVREGLGGPEIWAKCE